MRKLNKQQKQILTDWFEKTKKEVKTNKNSAESLTFDFDCDEDLPYDIYEKVRDLNDFETFNQAVNRFITDLLNED